MYLFKQLLPVMHGGYRSLICCCYTAVVLNVSLCPYLHILLRLNGSSL